MDILTFNYEYPPLGGGGGVVHALIAEELASRHRVTVVTSAYKDLPPHEVRAGVEVYRVPVLGQRDESTASLASMLSYAPSAWAAARRLLRRRRFDVVNAHFAVPTGPAALATARRARIPHVISLHGGDIYDPSKRISPHRLPAVRVTVGAVLRGSDAVIAQSTDTRKNAYRYYSYRGPIELIPLGIRQPAVLKATRDDLGLPGGVFLAVTVGRLVKRKGLEYLLRALARPECHDIHLAVVGTGPELAPLSELSGALGLADRVKFLGRVEETRKWQILRCADAYVSSTLHEGFGLVYLEAMAAGLPVVTPSCGGQMDFLEEGRTGYLVPPCDEVALAAAMARLLSSPKQAAIIGESNRKRSVRHRIETCAAAYEMLFYRLIGRPPTEAARPNDRRAARA